MFFLTVPQAAIDQLKAGEAIDVKINGAPARLRKDGDDVVYVQEGQETRKRVTHIVKEAGGLATIFGMEPGDTARYFDAVASVSADSTPLLNDLPAPGW
jgi:hypothetical protein